MYSIKYFINISILLLFFTMGFADVSHNADFPISGLNIQAILEPADSNYYHHITVSGCMFKTESLGYPEVPYKVINLVIPANEEVFFLTLTFIGFHL